MINTTAQSKKKIQKKPVTEKEIFHFFYHIGAADGIANSLSGGKPDFEKRYEEYKKITSETK